MAIDFSKMSSAELKKLLRDAQSEHQRKAKRKPIASVRAKIEKAASNLGYSIEELFGTKSERPKQQKPSAVTKSSASSDQVAGKKVAPKFRDPAKLEHVWSGRGKQPKWLVAAIKDGADLDSFRIEK